MPYQKEPTILPLRPAVKTTGQVRPGPSDQRQAVETNGPPAKRARIVDPEPAHNACFRIKATLSWRNKNHQENAHGFFLVDSGCTGPILNEAKIRKLRIPVHRRKNPVEIYDASGGTIQGAGEYYTRPLDMIIGKHEEALFWEVSPLPEDILGYLPISWLRRHNPDINWEFGTLKWRSPHCQKHCLPSTIVIEGISMEELLQEDPENVYQVGAMIYHDEEGRDIALRLPEDYREWSDVFSQERIQALPEHSSFDHKIDLLPNTTPPFGPRYPCSTSELKAMKTWLDNCYRK